MTLSADLRAVHDRIKAHGLHREAFRSRAGNRNTCSVCVLGAIYWVANGNPNDSDRHWGSRSYPMLKALGEQIYPDGGACIWSWSDSTPEPEVLATILAAAERAEAAGQ